MEFNGLKTDFPDGRTVAVGVSTEGVFLLRFYNPDGTDAKDLESYRELTCKIEDGKRLTMLLLSPETMNAMLQSAMEIVAQKP